MDSMPFFLLRTPINQVANHLGHKNQLQKSEALFVYLPGFVHRRQKKNFGIAPFHIRFGARRSIRAGAASTSRRTQHVFVTPAPHSVVRGRERVIAVISGATGAAGILPGQGSLVGALGALGVVM